MQDNPANINEETAFHRDQILGGRYKILSVLGRGGMGVVYKVEQILLGKQLALKTIENNLLSDIRLRRFQGEARAGFSIDHPNVISVYDFGFYEDRIPFLVIEFIQGQTLSERMQQRRMPVNEVISMFAQICLGVAHAHQEGVVHRDLKPSNIMLVDGLPIGTEGSVKIMDFGIAKLAESENGAIQQLTRTGEVFGSPLYMSPEQCLGEKVDFRSDVYSLGCVLFEALSGTPPFVGETAISSMVLHQTGALPTLKEASMGSVFPDGLEQIISTMLAKNPDDRYQNLTQTAHDLAAIGRGEKPSYVLESARKAKGASADKVITIGKKRFYLLATASLVLGAVASAIFLTLAPY